MEKAFCLYLTANFIASLILNNAEKKIFLMYLWS